MFRQSQQHRADISTECIARALTPQRHCHLDLHADSGSALVANVHRIDGEKWMVHQQRFDPEGRYLNDPYRDLYRAHRKSVDDADKEAKKGATTLWRSLGRKLLGTKPPPSAVVVSPAHLFTVPPFNATEPQRGNMQVLLSMLLGSSQKADPLEIAELYRELENYDEAQKAIEQFEAEEHVASKLLRELIKEKANEPMRYRM